MMMMEGNTFFNITLSFWTNNNRPTSTLHHHNHQNGSTSSTSTSAISASTFGSNPATTVNNNNNVANKSDWSSLASDNHNHTNTNTSTNHGANTNGHGGGSSSPTSSSSSFIEKKSPSFIFLFGTNNNNNNTNNNKTNNNHNYTASKSSLRPLTLNRNPDSSLPLLNQTSGISHYNQHHQPHQQHHPRNAPDHDVQHVQRPFPYITTNRTTNNRHDHDPKSSMSHHQDDTLTILDDLPSIRPISDDYGGGDGDGDYLATFTTSTTGAAAHNNHTTINIINNNKSTATSVDPFDSWIWSNVTDSNDSLDYWRNVFYSNSSSYYTNNNHSNGSSSGSSSGEVNLWNKAQDCIGINKFQEACLMDTMNGDLDGDNFTSTIDHIDPERSYWALVLIILPILALFGNFLVILSVYRERSLQTVTNWFIVSLAFADLFVTIPMLFCTYVMVNVDWELSETLCDLYIAIDVICSTASIFNLVAISFDRYIAVTHPIFYSKHKNDKRVIITIILVWMASFGVGLPIMLGANTSPERIPELCIFYNSDFIIYSSLWSFYVPCLIMVILYYKIFKAIHDRARKKMDHLSSSSSNKNKSTLLSNTHNTTVNNTNANTNTANNNNTNANQPNNNNNNNANNPSTNKAKNILGIVDNSGGGPHKSSSAAQRGQTVIDNNLSLNKQLQMNSTTTGTGTATATTTGTATTGGIMKLVDQTKVKPIEANDHNHTSIALISEININISQDNSNNTESHLDDFDDDDEEDDDDDDDDDDVDDDLEQEPPEVIEFKNVVVQHKCSNSSKLVTSELLHCSTTTKSNRNNSQYPLNETNFNDPKSMDAENKGQSNNKCEMFLVEKSAQQLSTGQRHRANNDQPLGCQSCPKLEIKSPTNTNDNGSTSGFISGGGITTILDNRQDDGDNGTNKNGDDDGAMNPETGHDGYNDGDTNLTLTKPTIITMAVGVNFNDQTTNNNNNNKNNSVMARRIQLQQRQQQLANSNNNKNNDNDAAAATSLVVCGNQYSKKKSRFNLGRKHKSSRKKREKVSARRERKATKTLAIVLGVFLLCWTPFFSCNIWDAICIKLHENHFIRSDCRPGMTAFLLTTWLGYMNSCANPLIYTIFNTEFRKAFRKILCSK